MACDLASIPAAIRHAADARTNHAHVMAALTWASPLLICAGLLAWRGYDRFVNSIVKIKGAALACMLLVFLTVTAVLLAPVMVAGLAVAMGFDLARAAFLSDLRALPAEVTLVSLSVGALIGARALWPRWGFLYLAATVVIIALTLIVSHLSFDKSGYAANVPPGANTGKVISFARDNGVPIAKSVVFPSADPLAVSIEGTGQRTTLVIGSAAATSPSPELYAELGHLMGHYKHADVLGIYVVLAGMGLLLLWCFWYGGSSSDVEQSLSERLTAGIRRLPRTGLLVFSVAIIETVGFNIYDQTINFGADEVALEATKDPDAFCRWLVTTGADTKADPSPIEAALFYTHPPLARRLDHAVRWRRSHCGPLRRCL